MSNNILGIIGFGSIGERHFKILRKSFRDYLIIILINKKKIKLNSSNHSIKITNSFSEFLNYKPKNVFICSPATTHIDYALRLAKNNINILIEKPLSNRLNLNKFNSLKKIIKKNNLNCYTGYVFRHDDLLINFKNIINKYDSKLIKYISCEYISYLPNWREKKYTKTVSANKKFGGGVILECSHEIDYIYYLFGKLSVNSSLLKNSGDLKIDVEDSAQVFFNTKNNIPIMLNLDFNSNYNSRSCTLYLKNKILSCDFNKRIIYVTNNNFKNKIIYKSKFPLSNAYTRQNYNFVKQIKDNKYDYCTIDQSINVMKIMDEIFKKNVLKTK